VTRLDIKLGTTASSQIPYNFLNTKHSTPATSSDGIAAQTIDKGLQIKKKINISRNAKEEY